MQKKDQNFLINWKENVFCKAFNKIKYHELFNCLYFQPDRFNREIIGKRLKLVMLKIKLKLKKIRQAKRVVDDFFWRQKFNQEDDLTKDFII